MEGSCTLLVDIPKGSYKHEELVAKLESKDVNEKIEALKYVVASTVTGQPMPKLLIHIIKYCMKTDHHGLKKVLLSYWEAVDKHAPDGSLLNEMILVW